MGAAFFVARSRLRRQLGATALVAVLVGLIGAAVLSAIAGARRTETAPERLAEQSRLGDVWLDGSRGLDDARMSTIEALPQVAGSARVLSIAVVPVDDTELFLPWTVAVDGRYGTEVDRSRLLEGRLPRPGTGNEVALTERRAQLLGLGVGDALQLAAYSPEQVAQANESSRADPGPPTVSGLNLRVVGITRSATDVATDDPFGSVSTFPPAFLDEYGERVGIFGTLLLVDLRDPAEAEAFVAAIHAIPGLEDYQVEPIGSFGLIDDVVHLSARGLLVFAAIAGAAGAFTVALVLRRRAQIDARDDPVLAGLGSTRAQRVVAEVLGLLPGIAIGAMAAVGLALVGSTFLPFGLAGRAEPDPGVHADWVVLGPGLAIVVLVAGGLTVLAAIGASRSSERGDVVHARVGRLIARFGLRPSAAAGVRFALDRGTGTRSLPVLTTLLAAVLGISGVVAAFVYSNSLDRVLQEPEAYGWDWDVTAPGDVESWVEDPAVDAATRVRVAFVEFAGRPVEARGFESLRGSPPDVITKGRMPSAPDDVALGAETMRELHLAIGDRVTARGVTGAADLRIVGQAVFAGVSDAPTLAEGALLTEQGLTRLSRLDEDDSSFASLALRFAPGEADEALARLVDVVPPHEIEQVPTPPSELRQLGETRWVPAAVGAFLAILATVAVGYGVVSALARRLRELAVMKALGLRRRGVRIAALCQATTVLLAGLLVGVPLGVAVGRLLWRTQAQDLGVEFVPVFHVLVWGLALALGGTVVYLCALLASRKPALTWPARVLRAE